MIRIVEKTFLWKDEAEWIDELEKEFDMELIAVCLHSISNEKTYYFRTNKKDD